MLKMYSQNDETGVSEVLESKFSSLANHGGKTFKEKFSPWILQCSGGISVSFLKRKTTLFSYSQKLREKIRNCKSSNIP